MTGTGNSAQGEKAQALASILRQMQQHDISISELSQAMNAPAGETAHSSAGDTAARLFSTLGGIFVFAGLCVYISMFWGEMNTAMRLIVTLGAGLGLHTMALTVMRDSRFERNTKSLLMVAAILQTTGWFVAIDEFFPHSDEPRHAVLLVMGLMAIQQGSAFYRHRVTVLLFNTLLFSYLFTLDALSLLDANEKIVFMGLGISMMALAQAIRPTPHAKIAGLGYFIGATMFYYGCFDLVQHTSVELLYLGVAAALIYVSTLVRSSALLATSTIAMLCYISYFTHEHFVNSVGWPVSLMLLGGAFYGVSAYTLRIKRSFMN